MRPHVWISFACGAVACLACTDTGRDAPFGVQAMTYYGCETNPECSGGGGGGGGGFAIDPYSAAAGYWIGPTLTPSTSTTASGPAIYPTAFDRLRVHLPQLL